MTISTTTAYRLHYFPESGNSYKLALMLTLCGQTFEPVWIDFGGGMTRTPEWRSAVNVMAESPVLEDAGTWNPPVQACPRGGGAYRLGPMPA